MGLHFLVLGGQCGDMYVGAGTKGKTILFFAHTMIVYVTVAKYFCVFVQVQSTEFSST